MLRHSNRRRDHQHNSRTPGRVVLHRLQNEPPRTTGTPSTHQKQRAGALVIKQLLLSCSVHLVSRAGLEPATHWLKAGEAGSILLRALRSINIYHRLQPLRCTSDNRHLYLFARIHVTNLPQSLSSSRHSFFDRRRKATRE
jgi:hypothetical protein